jgi:hypothetical protein
MYELYFLFTGKMDRWVMRRFVAFARSTTFREVIRTLRNKLTSTIRLF